MKTLVLGADDAIDDDDIERDRDDESAAEGLGACCW